MVRIFPLLNNKYCLDIQVSLRNTVVSVSHMVYFTFARDRETIAKPNHDSNKW